MNFFLKNIVRLILVFGCCLHINAQPYNYRFDLLNETNGLSSRKAEYIIQDYRGYIWIATGNGLNRYDGYSFKVYKNIPGDSTSLLYNGVFRMLEDRDHKIWVSYLYQNGLSCFDPVSEKFTNFYPDKKNKNALPTGYVSGLFIDHNNDLWIGISQNGFAKFSKSKKNFIHYSPLPDIDKSYPLDIQKSYNTVYRFIEIGDSLWMASQNGLYVFEKSTGNISSVRPYPVNPKKVRDDCLTSLVADSNNGLWMGSWLGALTYYNYATHTWKNFKYDTTNITTSITNIIHNLSWKSKTELWCSVDMVGLMIFNTQAEKFYNLENNASKTLNLPNALYRDVYTDRTGNLWMAHYKGISLLRASSSIFSFHEHRITRSDNGDFYGLRVIIKDTINNLTYIGMDYSDGLNVVDGKTGLTEHFKIPKVSFRIDYYSIRDFFIDKKGMLWVITNNYFFQFDPKQKKIIMLPQPDKSFSEKPNLFYIKMLQDKNGDIWIATWGKGLYRYHPQTQEFVNFIHDQKNKNSLVSDSLKLIIEDKLHRVWIGSEDKGVSLFDSGKNIFYNFQHSDSIKNSLINNSVYGISADEKNKIWIATEEGISCIDGTESQQPTFTNYTVQQGLPDNFVYNIFCQEPNSIWLTTIKGLHRWQPELNQLATFNERNGLDENYHIYSFNKGPNKDIFIGTYHGYYHFYPQQIPSGTSPPDVLINTFRVFDKEFPFQQKLKEDGKINLSYRQNYFSFEFASINYSDPEKVKYAYQLEEIDNDWIYCDNRRFANYTNIAGGNYTFKVKAMNGDGVWMKNPLEIAIHIKKPFWQTAWFKVAMLIMLLIILRLYFLYQRRKQQEEEADKSITYFANSIYGGNSEEEILWDMARNVIARLNFSDCVIYLVDEERNVLIQKAAMGEKKTADNEVVSALEIPIGQGIVGAVALRGQAEIVGDTSKDKRYIADDDVRLSEIAVPIIYRGKVIGVIDSEHHKRDFYKLKHLKFLETIASISATKIVKAKTDREVEEKEKSLLEAAKQVAEMRLQAIRAQMNPHFIFNCLNSIDKYILKNDEVKASRYLNKFAKLIRLILNQSERLHLPLATENEMLLYYMELESIRFEIPFQFEISVDENMDADDIEIPGMIIQPYIENAIWHGFMNKPDNGKITITYTEKENMLLCVVEDNGIGRTKAMEYKMQNSTHQPSKGMKLTAERISILNAKSSDETSVRVIDLKDDSGNACGTRVELMLPIM
ncbi:MAG: two-component regulator propeller domain-containing protein [Bacteroidia bacterium]